MVSVPGCTKRAKATFLIDELRFQDQEFRNLMSPIAVKAAAIVRDVRQAEIASLQLRDSEGGTDQPAPHSGQSTTLTLRDILVRLPKGCLLHAHFDALIDCKALLKARAVLSSRILSSPSDPTRGIQSLGYMV